MSYGYDHFLDYFIICFTKHMYKYIKGFKRYFASLNFSVLAVLVRRGPDNKAELVLLDHGLYEYLSQR